MRDELEVQSSCSREGGAHVGKPASGEVQCVLCPWAPIRMITVETSSNNKTGNENSDEKRQCNRVDTNTEEVKVGKTVTITRTLGLQLAQNRSCLCTLVGHK